MGFDRYGVVFQLPTEIGIFGSKRPLVVETPAQFRGGKLDVGEIGAFTYLGNPNSLFRHIGKIGRFCAIAGDIQMGHVEHSIDMLTPHPMFISKFEDQWREANSLYEDMDFINELRRENGKTIKRTGLIEIGNDVWIGYGAYISRGVTIGDGAVIAAKSVVVKDVPPYTVVGGTPAKAIKQRFKDNIIEELLRLKWWDYGPEILKGVRINDMEETLFEIEDRISKGYKKYEPDKIEFNLAHNTINLISADNVRTMLKKF